MASSEASSGFVLISPVDWAASCWDRRCRAACRSSTAVRHCQRTPAAAMSAMTRRDARTELMRLVRRVTACWRCLLAERNAATSPGTRRCRDQSRPSASAVPPSRSPGFFSAAQRACRSRVRLSQSWNRWSWSTQARSAPQSRIRASWISSAAGRPPGSSTSSDVRRV